VHRTDRTNAASLQHQSERIIDVQWAPSPSSVFLVAIRVLADAKLNILSASVTTPTTAWPSAGSPSKWATRHLGHLLNVVRNVKVSTTSTA
jgi:GTP diphosphokinase / guanosine-3',5'-bis(diphosphate) 3'-diphosphatase